MFPIKIKRKAEKVFKLCLKKKINLTFAESCTGGLLSSLITSIPNSSKIFDSSFITYSDFSKEKLLGIQRDDLKKWGAVSKKTAESMAQNILMTTNIDLALSITGIAGPGGATKNKKVGLVFISFAFATWAPWGPVESDLTRRIKLSVTNKYQFKGTRDNIRISSVNAALDLILVNLPNCETWDETLAKIDKKVDKEMKETNKRIDEQLKWEEGN